MYKRYLVIVQDTYYNRTKMFPYIMARSADDAKYQVHRMLKWDVNRFHIVSITENKEG